MSDSQAGDPPNETGVPESAARGKKPVPSDLPIAAVLLGVFGAILGALVTRVFNLDLVWQASGAVFGAFLLVSIAVTFFMMAFRARQAHQESGSFVKPFLRVAVVFAAFLAVIAALLGAFVGAVAPNGGPLLAVQLAGVGAVFAAGAVLFVSMAV